MSSHGVPGSTGQNNIVGGEHLPIVDCVTDETNDHLRVLDGRVGDLAGDAGAFHAGLGVGQFDAIGLRLPVQSGRVEDAVVDLDVLVPVRQLAQETSVEGGEFLARDKHRFVFRVDAVLLEEITEPGSHFPRLQIGVSFLVRGDAAKDRRVHRDGKRLAKDQAVVDVAVERRAIFDRRNRERKSCAARV